MQLPAAGRHAASTTSTSPPSQVTPKSRATPGRGGRGRDLLIAELRCPEPRGQRFRPHLPGQRKTLGPQARHRGRSRRRRQHAPQVQQQAQVAVTERWLRAGSSASEQRLGRRLVQPVELAENHQPVVADVAGRGPSCPRASTRRPRPASGAGPAMPRIAAGSSAPASGTRTKRRPRAAARARAKGILPVPAGPQRHRTLTAAAGASPRLRRRQLARHQVVDRQVLLPVAADVFPVKRLPHLRRRGGPLRRPPPRQLLQRVDRREVRRRPTTRSRSRESATRTGSGSEPYRGGPRIPADPEVEPVRLDPRRLVGGGDDGDRGGPRRRRRSPPGGTPRTGKWRRAGARNSRTPACGRGSISRPGSGW